MDNLKIVAHLPARHGSVRVKVKNLKLLDGQPLISYSIETAKNSKRITDFYVNTESPLIASFARDRGVKVFERDKKLASDEITLDTFNYDFVSKVAADILVLINPVCPLIDGGDVDAAVDQLLNNNLDTVLSVLTIQLHCIFNNSPLNFDSKTVLPNTQDIEPILVCNWAIGVWRVSAFKEHFEKYGHAKFVGKVGYYNLPPAKAVKISTEDDFKFAEIIIKGRKNS